LYYFSFFFFKKTETSPQDVNQEIPSISDYEGLNSYLSLRSYLIGYSFSPKDVEVFNALSSGDFTNYPHLKRWYKHIQAIQTKSK